MIEVIAAVDEHWGIGREGKMPWHYPEDLKFFKKYTTGSSLIMGKKTWESVGKLPERTTYVLSKQTRGMIDGVHFCSFNEFMNRNYQANHHYFVVGGEAIYTLFMQRDLVKTITLTRIPGEHTCDRFFPHSYMGDFQKFEVQELTRQLKVERFTRKLFT